jgi:hypothetical protein
MSRLALAVCAAILWFVGAPQAQGSQTGCSPEELKNKNLLRLSDPAYADAIELAGTLHNHGFTIQCVLPSKFAQFLPRQTGAALFRTTMGDFEALFRPKERNFDDLFISEKRESWINGTGYRYTFRDLQGRMVGDMAGRETFFVRHHNILFVIWQKNAVGPLSEAVQQDER